MLDPHLYLLGCFLHVHAASAHSESHVGSATCAIRMNFQEFGDGIVARHRDTAGCAQPVSLYCRATSAHRGRICRHGCQFFSSLPTSNMELSAVPERPVLAPENTGCDTACMRLAVGLAGGRGLAWNAAGNAAAAGDRSKLLPRAFGAKTCMGFSHSTQGSPSSAVRVSASHATAAHARCQFTRGVALGLSRNRLGAGSPHYQLVDSEVPGSKI